MQTGVPWELACIAEAPASENPQPINIAPRNARGTRLHLSVPYDPSDLFPGAAGREHAPAGAAAGFHSCTLDSTGENLKLNKLYILPAAQGMGLGKALLSRVHALAASLGARKIWLQVNKNNRTAIRAYERAGYSVERAAVFDIGGGFVMDDFIMALAIPTADPLSIKDAAPVGT